MFREDQDHRNKRTRDWHRGNPAKSYVSAARGRAGREGLPFDLEAEDINFPDVCPVLGIPLFFSEDRVRTDNTPSIDKLKPGLGYVKGNVYVISWRANRLKGNATLDELERLVSYIKEKERDSID